MIPQISVPQAEFLRLFGDVIKENTRCAGNVRELLIPLGPRRKFVCLCACVCVCVCVHEWACVCMLSRLLLYTSYRLIQNLCCQLLWHWGVIAKRKKTEVKWKAAAVTQLGNMTTTSSSHLSVLMQKRRCFTQTNSAGARQLEEEGGGRRRKEEAAEPRVYRLQEAHTL